VSAGHQVVIAVRQDDDERNVGEEFPKDEDLVEVLSPSHDEYCRKDLPCRLAKPPEEAPGRMVEFESRVQLELFNGIEKSARIPVFGGHKNYQIHNDTCS
jgi:hypothetical protein